MTSFASPSLQWSLIRNTSSFLTRRDGFELSGEPLNVSNVNSFRSNGLVNPRAVGVIETVTKGKTKDSKPIRTISLRTLRVGNENSQLVKNREIVSQLNKNVRHHRSHGAKVIDSATRRAFYRRDLTEEAVAKFHRLQKSHNPIKAKKTQIQRTHANKRKAIEKTKKRAKRAAKKA